MADENPRKDVVETQLQKSNLLDSYEISSLTLHFLVKELQDLVDSKLDQVYQERSKDKHDFLFRFHSAKLGKTFLRVIPNQIIYFASHKFDAPESPPGFCTYLRKKLKNARVRSIRQLDFERIVEFTFEVKQKEEIKTFFLVFELFGGGNVLLLDGEKIILSAISYHTFKDRAIRPKNPYLFPKKEYDVLNMTVEDLNDCLKNSKKENLVKSLAIDLGFGGVYSEELCISANLDKNCESKNISKVKIKKLFESLQKLLSSNLAPELIINTEKKNHKDIVPFKLQKYANFQSQSFKSLHEAFDFIFTTSKATAHKETEKKVIKNKLSKLQVVVDKQTEHIVKLEKKEQEQQQKGELVYENYQLIDSILNQIKKARETLSWKEIKTKLKNHKIIKQVDEKKGELVIEL
ncbi:hypothetical protein HN587_05640 [Candidatus Woesearchaeota archaeon]|jgi:predicted ribosome quality control (RQC) complex YloA/Tae2 family protein|nr:hypothetical protein [Candidatus Woesearchaeota archaeon]